MYCSYCNKEIINKKRPNGDTDYSKAYKSSEHIIQNAIGGKLESEKICCDRCNFHLEELIDKAFCDIFVPFTSDIKDFKKTNNSNSEPKCSGYAISNKGNEKKLVYGEVIKGSKLKKSNELIKIEKEIGTENLNTRLKSSLNESKVVFNKFNLDNNAFKKGLSKIAYNYAIYLGINPKNISGTCEITLDEEDKQIKDINFNTLVIPFVPGTDFDHFIELETKFILFHNLILFRYKNELWCFIDLFNTFQYYVRLSNKYITNESTRYEIYGNECQYMQSNMNDIPVYEDIIMKKASEYAMLGYKYVDACSYNFYVNQDKLNPCFKIETPFKSNEEVGEHIFYPTWICTNLNQEDMARYATEKFTRLNDQLIKDKPTISEDEFFNMSKEDQEIFLDLLSKSRNPNK